MKTSTTHSRKRSKENNYTYGHRSSLRRAIRESLLDASATSAALVTSMPNSLTQARGSSRKQPSNTHLRPASAVPNRTSRSTESPVSSSSTDSSPFFSSSTASGSECQTPSPVSKNRGTSGNRVAEESTPSPTRRGWHDIKEIVGEGREHGNRVYLVEWVGYDPKSGNMWPSSWVSIWS